MSEHDYHDMWIIKPSSSTDLHYRLSLKTCQTTRHRGAADGDQVFTAEQQERHDIVQRLWRLRQDHDGQFLDLSEEHISVRVVQRTGEECEKFENGPFKFILEYVCDDNQRQGTDIYNPNCNRSA